MTQREDGTASLDASSLAGSLPMRPGAGVDEALFHRAVERMLPSRRYAAAGPPIIAASGHAYLAPPGALLAMSPAGEILWEQMRGPATSASVSLNGILLVADATLDAVMPDGRHRTLWHPPAPICTAPVLANSLIHLATAESLYVLEPG